MHKAESESQSLTTEPRQEIPALLVAGGSRSTLCRSHMALAGRTTISSSDIAVFDRNLPRLQCPGRSDETNQEHP